MVLPPDDSGDGGGKIKAQFLKLGARVTQNHIRQLTNSISHFLVHLRVLLANHISHNL
jgi:hypothetical protein